MRTCRVAFGIMSAMAFGAAGCADDDSGGDVGNDADASGDVATDTAPDVPEDVVEDVPADVPADVPVDVVEDVPVDGDDATETGAPGHTENNGGVMHHPDKADPLANCVACHGSDLTGGAGPSCYDCHDNSDHTSRRGGFLHRSGSETSCRACHGPTNNGGLGPACSDCHG